MSSETELLTVTLTILDNARKLGFTDCQYTHSSS